jgi:hypothetical protein
MNDDLWNAHLERLHTERYGPLSAIERERYGIPRAPRRARLAVAPKPLRRREASPFVASAPLRGVCHTCGARDVERTIPEGSWLPVCESCA